MYSYCYVYSVLYILLSLCCYMYCLCVNVYFSAATGCQPTAVNKYECIISYHITYHIISISLELYIYICLPSRPTRGFTTLI